MGYDLSTQERSRSAHPGSPRIVLLDAECANPGDLSWDGLRELGELVVYDVTPPEAVVSRCAGATVAVTNKTVLSRAAFESLPELRFVSVLATGVNVVDLEAAAEHDVVVSNVPAYSTSSTAQHTIALLLELAHRVGDHARGVREGRWSRSRHFSYWEHPLVELDGLTLGLVGFGAIARRVAEIGRALGMLVSVHTRTPDDAAREVRFVDKDTLFRESDVVSLHCPLTEQTRNLVDEGALQSMKPSAFLINTSRGPVIDEGALARALERGTIAGAALDVLSQEPPRADHPLLRAPNCLVTPHIAWATLASRKRLLDETTRNVKAFLEGQPIHVCRT